MRVSALVVMVAACLSVCWSFVTSAQVDDSSACEQSCQEQESVCVSACETHANPVECEARCHEERDDCLEQCR